MEDINRLVQTIKRHLKAKGMTYRMLAEQLQLSEVSIKRSLSTGQMTLARLADIAHCLDMTLAELALATLDAPPIDQLTEAQEQQLVDDPQLLLVAVCVLNHWTLKDILAYYQLTEATCIRLLAQLDQLRLIDWLPDNRVRLKVSRQFAWRQDGPIFRFFRQQGERDFLTSDFHAEPDEYAFVHGMLTSDARRQFSRKLQQLREDFASLHQQSLTAPLSERHGVGVLLATRGWELRAFGHMRKKTNS
ncbi:helix-turn-helix domain-containing protein [Leeia oryzae]|uniref:helix-turn-helix domain-containing protein n=1 Tax=Leeia oryzae TaxID=356662 RepID=UPI000375A7D7|nr:helix-turn-helix transcriptional regulator [Leeia oryzae]